MQSQFQRIQSGVRVDTVELSFSEPESRPRTRIRAFVTGVLAGFVLPALVLVALPVLGTSSRDVRHSEGEQMAGALKNYLRVYYAKTGELPNGSQFPAQDFTGTYYHPALVVGFPTPASAEVFMIPKDEYNATIRYTFEWESGAGEFEYLGKNWAP